LRHALYCATIAIMMLVAPALASACSCTCKKVGDGGPLAMERHSAAVFVGQAIEVTEPTEAERQKNYYGVGVKFRVERYWKGVKTQEIVVVHTRFWCCHPALNPGKRYLVYAIGKNLETGCTRTVPIERAEEDLRVLGPGKSFEPSATDTQKSPSN